MTIEELIISLGNRKYIDSDYSELDKCEQAACEKANKAIDDCTKLVKDFQKEREKNR